MQKKKEWLFTEPFSSDDEEEEQDETHQKQERKKQQGPHEMGEEKEEDQKMQPENPSNSVVNPILESQVEGNKNNQCTGGNKRPHFSKSFDLDKETSNITRNNLLEIFPTSPPLGVQKKVQKKKSKKHKSVFARNV